ncbi:anther-specific protein BCP1-like [Hibiscus syriacus]|uniref:anther-specific protein BCP1-like n=1 Tax=Hibiscus syriacus TaxID=106335 RepID=UPI001922A305|nr:anther-specific protein BCP1-like [Hibiscus syriacus]
MTRQIIIAVALVFLAVVGAYAAHTKPSPKGESSASPSSSPTSSPSSGSAGSTGHHRGHAPPSLDAPAPAPSDSNSLKASGVIGVATGVAGLFFFI